MYWDTPHNLQHFTANLLFQLPANSLCIFLHSILKHTAPPLLLLYSPLVSVILGHCCDVTNMWDVCFNNYAECWGRRLLNVFSASLSLAISVDVQQREGHMVSTILSNQESALLYVTSTIAPACLQTYKCVKMSLVKIHSHSQSLNRVWLSDTWFFLMLQLVRIWTIAP